MTTILPRDIIGFLCSLLDIKTIKALNQTNKDTSLKVTYYMLNNFMYNCSRDVLEQIELKYGAIKDDEFKKDYNKNLNAKLIKQFNIWKLLKDKIKSVIPNKTENKTKSVNFKDKFFKYVKHVKTDDVRVLKLFKNDIKTLVYDIKDIFMEELFIEEYDGQTLKDILDIRLKDKLGKVENLHVISNLYLRMRNIDLKVFLSLKKIKLEYLNGCMKNAINEGKDLTEIIIVSTSGIYNFKGMNFENLKYFSPGNQFRESMEDFNCENIEYLDLGYINNMPIEKCKFKQLKYLKFGKMFNQPIENTYFPELEYLEFSGSYLNLINKLKCSKLKCLTMIHFTNELYFDKFKENHPNCKYIFL